MNIQRLIWGLEELSDRELQEKVWTGNADGEMSSFVEAVCSTFDDSGLSHVLDSHQPTGAISSEVIEMARRLDRLVKRIPQSAAPLDIIHHPAMSDIRVLAAELLDLLKR
jgi:hypothetical protein